MKKTPNLAPGETPGPWTVMEGKTLLHIETANMGDGAPCGMPVCSLPKNRRQDADLIAAAPETARQRDELLAALQRIRDLTPEPFVFPADWKEQIAVCPECQGWAKNHPIQRGICNLHRKPLYARDWHEQCESEAIGPRAQIIAREAILAIARRQSAGKAQP